MTQRNRAEGDVDQIVKNKFFPGGSAGRVFVDVGAASPDFLSVSALFRVSGWRVIAIEPNPDFCAMHREKGYEILQYACGDHDEDGVEFSVVDSHGADYTNGSVSFESFSSLGIKEAFAALKPDLDIRKIKVDLRRLDTILEKHSPGLGRIDILSVDVEGWEIEVLDGIDMSRHKPRVMIIENLFNDAKYRTHMQGLGYALWKCLPPNDVYVSTEMLGVKDYLRWQARVIWRWIRWNRPWRAHAGS